MIIKKLVWDEWNADHIGRHHVNQEEVVEVCRSKNIFTRGRGGSYKVIGQADSGRYLTIILSPRAGGYFYPMTARDADNKEKRRFKNEKK